MTRKLSAVVLAAIAICIVVSGCSATQPPAANHTHVSTPSPASTNKAAPVITAQSVEIPDTTPVNQLGQVIFTDRYTAWMMGGADKASVREYDSGNLELNTQAAKIADPIDAAFVQGMFTPAALAGAATLQFIKNTESNHESRLAYYLITGNDPKVYRWNCTANQTEVISQTSSGVEVHVTETEHNNVTSTDKIGSKYGPAELQDNGATGVFDIKLIDVSGVFKVNSIASVTS